MTTEKIEAFWENATAEDVARVMAGETVEARFRDDEHSEYTVGLLAGWTKGDPSWMSRKQAGSQSYFVTCQVYREPSWWTSKPDPGPEWRLLGKFPDEELKPGDECFGVSGVWGPSCQAKAGGHQVFGIWYRRRIEAVEPKFAAGQTVRVVGPKGSDAKHWSEKMNQHIGMASPIKAREKKDDGWFYELGCSAIWSFDEDYLEPVGPVEQLIAGGSYWHPNGLCFFVTEKGFEVTE
jgi:hypothetical protein